MQESIDIVQDKTAHRIGVGLVLLPFGYMLRHHLLTSIKWMVLSIKQDPIKMLARLVTSCIVGQGVFWKIGYDQISEGGFKPKFERGLIRKISDPLADKVPDSLIWVWSIKVVEIVTDAGKMPLETTVMRRHGFVSDGVAFAFTQPLWSLIEAIDKLVGAVQQPEYVRTREGLRVSIGSILGSILRYVLAGLGLRYGKQVIRYISDPIERVLRWTLCKPSHS